jgi:excisionase family DNA binding protein
VSGSPLTTANAREQALEGVADALRRVADVLHLLVVAGDPAPGPRLVATTREAEVLLTVQEAAELLKCSPRHVERLVQGKPCRRRAGRRVLIERAGLLALLKRG